MPHIWAPKARQAPIGDFGILLWQPFLFPLSELLALPNFWAFRPMMSGLHIGSGTASRGGASGFYVAVRAHQS